MVVKIIELLFIKLYLIIVIITFLIGTIFPLILIQKKGLDPHGTHEGCSALSRLTPISITIWLLFVILYIFFDDNIKKIWSFDLLISDTFIIIGMIVTILGFIIEVVSIKALGLNYRIDIPKEKIELVTSGIYRHMRNPIYFGLYLLLIGIFLIIPNVISLIILIANIFTFNSKARDEERFLSTRFGEIYEEYKNRVRRYLPFKKRKKIYKSNKFEEVISNN